DVAPQFVLHRLRRRILRTLHYLIAGIETTIQHPRDLRNMVRTIRGRPNLTDQILLRDILPPNSKRNLSRRRTARPIRDLRDDPTIKIENLTSHQAPPPPQTLGSGPSPPQQASPPSCPTSPTARTGPRSLRSPAP